MRMWVQSIIHTAWWPVNRLSFRALDREFMLKIRTTRSIVYKKMKWYTYDFDLHCINSIIKVKCQYSWFVCLSAYIYFYFECKLSMEKSKCVSPSTLLRSKIAQWPTVAVRWLLDTLKCYGYFVIDYIATNI